jgi:hypothetical protein
MTNSTTIDALNSLTGFSNAAQVTYFECTRRKRDGSSHEIIVEVHDHGEKAPRDTRYGVFARDKFDPSKRASSNGGANIQTAIAVAHWGDLG